MSDYSEKIKAAIEADDVLLSFLFHIGNTKPDDGGQVGACLRVIAETPLKAVESAQLALASRSAENNRGYASANESDVEYVANYYVPENVSEEDLIKSDTEVYDIIQKEEAMKGAYEQS